MRVRSSGSPAGSSGTDEVGASARAIVRSLPGCSQTNHQARIRPYGSFFLRSSIPLFANDGATIVPTSRSSQSQHPAGRILQTIPTDGGSTRWIRDSIPPCSMHCASYPTRANRGGQRHAWWLQVAVLARAQARGITNARASTQAARLSSRLV